MSDLRNVRVVPVKDERSALIEFCSQLERADRNVILMCHSKAVFMPAILHILSRNNLLTAFASIVVGVTDVQAMLPDHFQEIMYDEKETSIVPNLSLICASEDLTKSDSARNLWYFADRICPDSLKKRFLASALAIESAFFKGHQSKKVMSTALLALNNLPTKVIGSCSDMEDNMLDNYIFVPSRSGH